MTEDKMVEWHNRLNGRKFEQALGDGEGQGGLVCCSPWGHRVGHNLASEPQTVYEHQKKKKRNKTRKLGKSDKDLNARAKL